MMSKINILNPSLRVPSKPSNLLRKSITLAAVAACAISACSAVQAQPFHTNASEMSFSRGTVIPVILSSELSSNGSNKGDTFAVAIDNGKIANYGRSMHDATLMGVVNDVTPETGTHPGTIYLKFTTLRLADGRIIPVSGSLTTLDANQVHFNKDGIMQGKNTRKDHRDAFAGVGTGIGALVSTQDNGDLKVEDVMVGGESDYAAGSTVVDKNEQGHDIDLKQGTSMGVILNETVGFERHADQAWVPNRNHETYVKDGQKYYSFNGQPWVMNIASGDRFPVTDGFMHPMRQHGKNYTFQGHRYHINLATGVRTQLD